MITILVYYRTVSHLEKLLALMMVAKFKENYGRGGVFEFLIVTRLSHAFHAVYGTETLHEEDFSPLFKRRFHALYVIHITTSQFIIT